MTFIGIENRNKVFFKILKSWYIVYIILMIFLCMNFYWYNKKDIKVNLVKLRYIYFKKLLFVLK